MLAPSRRRRLRAKVHHVLRSTMLCCGRRKEAREPVAGELGAGRRATGARGARAAGAAGSAHLPEMVVVQGDFRKVSGISTEIFNQIQAVENDHDATTAASLEAVERRGEMMIRILDPRMMGRAAAERARRFVGREPGDVVQFIEIVKRPGQTLGLYIREGNGVDRHEGVFISRIALESAVYNSGCLHVGDEILAVNLVDVTNVSLDDVVIIMSIPRRLVLTLRSRRNAKGHRPPPIMKHAEPKGPPVVVIKKELEEEPQDESNSNGENGILTLLPGPPPPPHAPYAVLEPAYVMEPPPSAMMAPSPYHEDPYLYYNSQPRVKYRHSRMPPTHMAAPTPHYPPPAAFADRDMWLTEPGPSTAAYPRVVTDQPRTLHAYPKTLESLAEKVHAFYSAPPRPEPGARRRVPPQGHPVPGARTLPPSRSERTLAPARPRVSVGGRLLRAESDQRLVGLARGESSYTIAGPSMVHSGTLGPALPPPPLRPSLKPTPSPPVPHHRHRHHHHHHPPPTPPPPTATSAMQTARRLSALRRRAPHADSSLSDTEAHATMPRSSILVRPESGMGLRPAMSSYGLRSNSLPRMRSEYGGGGRRHRHTVRFERDVLLPPPPHDSQDESDGAVSAPELPVRRERARIPSSPSVFTAAEYRAWLNRAPSTSAIYEKLKKSREVLQAQRAARITYSAENLLDHRGEEWLFHPRTLPSRSQTSRSSQWVLPTASMTLGSRHVRYLLDDGRHIPHPTPVRASDFRVHLLDINPAEFLKYRPEKEPLPTAAEEEEEEEESASRSPFDISGTEGMETGVGADGFPYEGQRGFSGLLWVHLLAGRGLKASGHVDHFRDLYCVLECDRVHKARTVVRTGDQNFDWDETFELDLLDNRELDLLVYSWDPQFRHKLCYRGSLQLDTLLSQSAVHQLALKIEPRGTLYLKLHYTDPGHAFQRMPSPRRTGGVFGVDLETAVNRENSGLSVPLLLKRCIDEVERRGLDIIGIYRLCGSASKKRMLKDAFERNPRRVDTSSDNVPDINVVAGVLKDYLRELPEPLFTKCLNQMLVDALSVCLPDDPEGNAKLMFSILDCLPKVNRCTLIMLMDHLKLVVSQSERNKMTAQNIALCFSPVLLVHTESTTATVDFRTPVQLLKYLLEIWPLKPENAGSDESADGQHGGDAESSDQRLSDQRLSDHGRREVAADQEQQQQQQVTSASGADDDEATATTPTADDEVWAGQPRVLPESSC